LTARNRLRPDSNTHENPPKAPGTESSGGVGRLEREAIADLASRVFSGSVTPLSESAGVPGDTAKPSDREMAKQWEGFRPVGLFVRR
jgi:hypothetical protein